jgi:hypothetical protein
MRDRPARVPLPHLWDILEAPLSDEARCLWLWYRKHDLGRPLGAYVGDDRTADALSWSARKVQGARAQLREHGYLLVHLQGPNRPSYYPLMPGADSHAAATQSDVVAHAASPQDSQDPANLLKEHPDKPEQAGQRATLCERRPLRPEEAAAEADFQGRLNELHRRRGRA